jgi:non-ribosomal peptide synthetase component E (peptide arylation enzyme)
MSVNLCTLLEQTAARQPDRPAVLAGDHVWTYGQLIVDIAAAQRLAHLPLAPWDGIGLAV